MFHALRRLFSGQQAVQPFVEWASEHGLYFLAKAFGMFGTGVRLKRFPVLPHLNDREVIQSAVLE